jgi:fibronectin-binding autotransporter adhesin
VKKGVGTLTLSATSSTYTGTTTVSGGTLLVNGFILSSAFGVQAGATLGGTGTVGPLTVAGTTGSNALIAPGNNTVGALSVSGATTLGPNSGIDLQISDWSAGAGSGYDALSVTGALSLTATPANPLVIRIDDINLPVEFFTETTTSFDIVTASGGITGFDASAISIDSALFTSGIGTWSVSQVGNSLRLTYSGTPFGNWIASKGLAGTPAGKDADPDGDGISNAIEFVLGTEPNPANPNSMSVGDLPVATVDANYLTIVFRRTDISAGADPVIEYGTDLSGWTTAVDGEGGVIVSVLENGIAAGIDQVTVKIPRNTETILFARLRATVLP